MSAATVSTRPAPYFDAEPVAVTGQAVVDEVDLRFTGTLSFPGDVLAHFDCGVDTADRAELEVVGLRGRRCCCATRSTRSSR